MVIPVSTPTGALHGQWSCQVLWDHRDSSSRRFGDWRWILQAVDFRQTICTLQVEILYANVRQSPKQHSAITETRNNQRSFVFISFEFQQRIAQASFASAIFSSAVTTRVTHGIPSLFHILTSLVHIGPLSLLTNRPCHGPWTNLGDAGTVWLPILHTLTRISAVRNNFHFRSETLRLYSSNGIFAMNDWWRQYLSTGQGKLPL